MKSKLNVVAAAATVITAASVSAQDRYELTLLGTLPTGNHSWAWGLNDQGQVVGGSEVSESMETRMFLWEAGQMTDLGVLPGFTHAWGADVNESGLIAGTSIGSAGFFATGRRPVIYGDQGMVDLGFGLSGTSIRDLNDAGETVGAMTLDEIVDDRFLLHAFYWDGTQVTDLGTLGGSLSQAFGLNDGGTIVGGSHTRDNRAYRAFVHREGRMQKLGTLGGRNSEARAVNDRDVIVGWVETQTNARVAALWYKDVVLPLGTLGGLTSEAHAINERSVIVGTARSAEDENRAFVLDPRDGRMRDLNDLIVDRGDFLAQEARDINSSGQIVGWGVDAHGEVQAFLLTPEL